MPNKFTRAIYRKGYLEARSLYNSLLHESHPWNAMAMRMKAYDRKMWLAAFEWEREHGMG